MSRLDRFKRLEAPRTERAGEGTKKTEARFSHVEQERAPGEAPVSRPAVQRMERQVSDQPLALDTRSTEEQQFIRCMICEADNGRFAQVCVHCGAALQTEQQRDFNEQFWRRRRSEAAQEQQAVDQLQQHQAQLTEEQARVQRQAFEQMVRESQDGSSGQPPGIRLINGLKDPIWQWVLIGGFVMVGLAAGVSLWRSHPDQAGLKWICTGALVVLAWLFTPPSWWSYGWRRRGRRPWHLGSDDYDDWL